MIMIIFFFIMRLGQGPKNSHPKGLVLSWGSGGLPCSSRGPPVILLWSSSVPPLPRSSRAPRVVLPSAPVVFPCSSRRSPVVLNGPLVVLPWSVSERGIWVMKWGGGVPTQKW